MKYLAQNMGGSVGKITLSDRSKYEFTVVVYLKSIDDAEEYLGYIHEKLSPQMSLVDCHEENITCPMKRINPGGRGIYYSGDGMNHCSTSYIQIPDPNTYYDSNNVMQFKI